MTGRKKTYIVDDFIAKLRSRPALQASPRRKRIVDDLEAVLETLFLSDDERAVEISDEIRGVIVFPFGTAATVVIARVKAKKAKRCTVVLPWMRLVLSNKPVAANQLRSLRQSSLR